MTSRSPILDQWGRPIERSVLTEEVAAATLSGVRSPLTGYPGDGLDPQRLAIILREADAGDPLRYLELAETIEERDLHYVGVLGTRRRSVAQIEVTVDAASDDAADVDRADLVRDWLTRDELAEETFDILDAVGKGYSFTEIIWDTSEGQWQPRRLARRDPRWFRPARLNLTTPMLIGENGEETPLPGGKFIQAVLRAKSGLPVRSGLARMVTWAWMFKAFTQRDWAIFTQTYGQPVRIGKYGPGATKEDRDTLYRAVANIAGDCAAIMPEGMSIEFIEASNLGTGHSNYMERSDWLDRQVSKGVLGQTTTTDAISGGHAVSQEHRQVQEDIERADARALSAVINRDLVRVWMDLEFGPQKVYPRIRIARPDEEDLQQLSTSLAQLVPLGLRVSQSEVRDKFGLADPDPGEEVLAAPARPEPAKVKEEDAGARKPMAPEKPPARTEATLHQQARKRVKQPDELIGEAALVAAAPAIGELVGRVRRIVARAGSLPAAEAALERAAAEQLTPPSLVAAMRQALLLAWLAGETAEDEDTGPALQSRKGFDPNQPRVPKGTAKGGEWTDDAGAAPGKSLRSELRYALRKYTESEYLAVNSWLRHGTLDYLLGEPAVRERIALLDEAITGAALPSAVTLWRGLSPSAASRLEQIGLKRGTVLEDPAFLSLSKSRDVANGFARLHGDGIVMRVAVPRGAPGLDLASERAGGLFGEQEVLFARGRRMRVVEWNASDGVLDMEMEE